MAEESHQIDELRAKARLKEHVFTSNVPLIGGLIAWFRNAWNSVATKWYVRPLIAQQTTFNMSIVDLLDQIHKIQSAGTIELEAWMVEEDREQARLTRQVAELAIRAGRLHRDGVVAGRHNAHRMQIAYFSPLPPARSGIADYSAELLPWLSQAADVTIFSNDRIPMPPAGLPVIPLAEYPANRARFDLALYQMGNSDHHDDIYEMLIRYPGIVVLHDYSLHHFMRHHFRKKGDWTGYSRELAYARGPEGWSQARAIWAGEAPPPLFDEPLNEHVIDVSLGLLVHSEYAAAGVRSWRPDIPLAIIPALVEPREGRSQRTILGIPDEAIIFGSFGQITAEKQIEAALRAFAHVKEAFPESHYLLVGDTGPDVEVSLEQTLDELGLTGCVHRIGFVRGIDEFVDWLHTADVVVNLRSPTAGETSATALRALAAARPLIVYNHGWYSEIPDETAIKVTPLDSDGLQAAMARLAGSAELRRVMGRAGQLYTRDKCHPEKVAGEYFNFMRETLERLGAVPF